MTSEPHAGRLWARSAAIVLLLFGFLPVASWIPGGRSAASYRNDLQAWLAGSAIVLGLAAIHVLATRRSPGHRRRGASLAIVRAWVRAPRTSLALLVSCAFALYAVTARVVFGARPLLIDEVSQLFQARLFAAGRLTAPLDPAPELFSVLNLVEHGGRVFSPYPPGGAAVLAVGVAVGAAWLVTPLCGALAAGAFAVLVRRVERARPSVSLLASLLFALAPFMVFMAGSQMSHVPALLAVVTAALALERATDAAVPRSVRRRWAAACGVALGVAATIRPADAAAFAGPAVLWLAWRALRDRGERLALVAAGVGIALPLACMLWFNLHTSGHPLRFGYEVLWGNIHSPGFHAAPWGPAHTPARGLELVGLYLLRLQDHLFDTPIPSLAPAVAALWLAPRVRPLDRMLLASGALLLALYFAYWHDGFYLGPRFVVCLLPVLALWTARLFPIWRARWGRGTSYRVVVAAAIASACIAALVSVPHRARQYRGGLAAMRWNVDSAARAAGVRRALVLVRESWGSQLVVRLWALGLSRAEAQALYAGVDACALERGIDSLERAGARGSAARVALRPLLADSARLVPNRLSADATERFLPGARYDTRCLRRLEEDRAGFTVYLPFVLARGDAVVYARDLHARDSVLLARYPDRPVYLVRPLSDRAGEPPRFWRVSRDSLRSAWAAWAVLGP